MPIADAAKKQIAQKRRLFFKVCMRCGRKNSIEALRCRDCHSDDLRLKNRQLGVKK
ncbi:MAG: 50S ribosomal protein L40e [Thaumarchaeota archaeon]|jgi:large subunit ribosomal protein L40e|nr:50S ribosomal protein L40e [Nitrososphaerota archaeon]